MNIGNRDGGNFVHFWWFFRLSIHISTDSYNVRFADYIANGLFSESGFITNYHKQ